MRARRPAATCGRRTKRQSGERDEDKAGGHRALIVIPPLQQLRLARLGMEIRNRNARRRQTNI